jgi:hypothetical protein
MSKFANSCNLKKNIINKPFFQLINSVKNMFEDYSNTMKDINGAQMTKLTDSLEYLNKIIKDLDKEFFEGPNLSNWLFYKQYVNDTHENLEVSIINKYVKEKYKREIKKDQKKEKEKEKEKIEDPI